jgi:hypothetical protein
LSGAPFVASSSFIMRAYEDRVRWAQFLHPKGKGKSARTPSDYEIEKKEGLMREIVETSPHDLEFESHPPAPDFWRREQGIKI